MENMIEVGEYIKTKQGKLDKVINNNYYMAQYIECERGLTDKSSIVKHSKNIIDLIEVGDYVNEYKVSDKESTLLFTNVKGIDRSGYHIPISQYGDGIKTILTKEQYEQNCYRMEE